MTTQVVAAGTRPPPSCSARSCVYVVRRPDGMFYCGQSDDLPSKRLSKRSPQRPHYDACCIVCCLIIEIFTWPACSMFCCSPTASPSEPPV